MNEECCCDVVCQSSAAKICWICVIVIVFRKLLSDSKKDTISTPRFARDKDTKALLSFEKLKLKTLEHLGKYKITGRIVCP